MSYLNTIPKNLPKTDPLQFSLLMALEVLKLNVNFNGGIDFQKYGNDRTKFLPAFEYAVNNWREVRPSKLNQNTEGIKLEQDVLCALWRSQPEPLNCEIEWTKYPNDDETLRKYDMNYLYEFEQWKLNTWEDLRRIISVLLSRAAKGSRDPITKQPYKLPADIWDFELVNNTITYIYAKDATANKFLGVGATFTLRSDTFDCCPAIDRNNYTLQRFEELGFIF